MTIKVKDATIETLFTRIIMLTYDKTDAKSIAIGIVGGMALCLKFQKTFPEFSIEDIDEIATGVGERIDKDLS